MIGPPCDLALIVETPLNWIPGGEESRDQAGRMPAIAGRTEKRWLNLSALLCAYRTRVGSRTLLQPKPKN
jgi:hypothetical protein